MSKLHPRTKQVAEAKLTFGLLVAEFLEQHTDLTSVEFLQMLNAEIATSLKYALRAERHGGRTTIPAEWANE